MRTRRNSNLEAIITLVLALSVLLGVAILGHYLPELFTLFGGITAVLWIVSRVI